MDSEQQLALQQLLLETFIAEAAEQLQALDAQLESDQPDWETTRRIAHTLKGSARAVGMRSAERSAMKLEYMFRRFEEQDRCDDDCMQKAAYLIEHIRYWSAEENARNLFSKQPVCILWHQDQTQSAVYQTLLQREGYQVAVAASQQDLDQAMQDNSPAVLLVVAENDHNQIESIWDAVEQHQAWQHAPVIFFSDSQESPPESIEIFNAGSKLAPGALMAGLESIREASA